MLWLRNLFSTADLTPHGFCLLWRPGLLWLQVVPDALIGLSYYSIPLALAYFVSKRRDIAFGWIFWMFAAFILGCGTTHFVEIWTLWYPESAAPRLTLQYPPLLRMRRFYVAKSVRRTGVGRALV
jgi:GNAT superfamily N-acetyltransferase